MTTTLTWFDLTLRLGLTLFAGAVIGFNRGERGRPAGLRTTMLVCLAASLSMIEVNELLGVSGKAPNSYVVLDLMRLPLGILSGMGFIGAGAIIHRENLAVGVTTAATLWFTTMLGLCIGGGQLGLGLVALAIGMVILCGLKWVEEHGGRDRLGTLIVVFETPGMNEGEVVRILDAKGYHVRLWKELSLAQNSLRREAHCEVQWHERKNETIPPSFIDELAKRVVRLEWKA